MKKIIFILISIFLLASSVMASSVTYGNSITIGDSTFSVSKQVTLNYSVSATDYAAEAHHANGKYYYCTSESESIVKKDDATSDVDSTATTTCE